MLEDPIGLPVLPVVDLGLEQLLGHALLHLPIHHSLCVFVRVWGRKKEIRQSTARTRQASEGESNVCGLRMATRANGHRHMTHVCASEQTETHCAWDACPCGGWRKAKAGRRSKQAFR